MSQFYQKLELEEKIDKLQKQLLAERDALPTKKMADGKSAYDISAERVAELKKRADEIYGLRTELKTLRDIESAMAKCTPHDSLDPVTPAQKSVFWLDRLAQASAGQKSGWSMDFTLSPAEVKATFSTAAGFPPESLRTGVVIDTVQKRPALLDYLQMVPTNQAAYVWVAETTHTNTAAEKAEGTAFDEATIELTEQSVTMQRLGVYLPVTDVQLADEVAAEALVQRRLADMVRNRAGGQVINGNGTAPNWRGLLNQSGIQTVTFASQGNNIGDALSRAIIEVMRSDATSDGGANPDVIVLNPTDWHNWATVKTSDGIYINGNATNNMVTQAWGLPIVVDSNLAAGTALVLDTSMSFVAIRRDVKVELTDSDGTTFRNGILTYRVDMRGNVVCYRGSSICQITGIV